jgi:hypothetical protein
MKKIKNYIVLVLLFALFFNSCELEEVNQNPNAVTEVPAYVLLPFNEESIADLMIGTGQVMAGIFVQYYEGKANHALPMQTYLVGDDLYPDWDFTDYYNGPMINSKKMIEIAEAEGDLPHYAGIGKTLMALCLGNLTSLWGDIPYSEALQGSLNRNPVYDSQQSIYESIQTLLDDAIADFNSENAGRVPAEDDIIFNGDMEKWKSTAYALKARFYMHLTKRTDDLDFNPAQEALNAIENGYVSSEEDLVYQYGFSAVEQSPFYSYANLEYIVPNSFFTMLMFGLDDPRSDYHYSILYQKASMVNAFYTSAESPVHMMTYYEQSFIEAEARLRLNVSDPEIQDALEAGIYASMKKISSGEIHDTTITQYIANNVNLTGNFENDLKTIMIQKYLAMYTSIEAWTDYRRTGYPILTPNPLGDHNQNPGGEIPRRLPYPESEQLLNSNIPDPLPTLQDRFWWDKD